MRTKLLISFFLILGTFKISYSQITEKEKGYIKKDTTYISELIKAYNISCFDFFEKLKIHEREREDLGFDYELLDSGIGLGSISFKYKVLFYKNEVLAYEISTEISEKKTARIRELYKEMLSKIFEVKENYEVVPISFDMNLIYEPLNGTELSLNDDYMELFNPFFSKTFGTMCGERMTLLKNRKLFKQIISKDNCEFFLYSLNPATRILAVEFYYLNKKEFSKNQKESIDSRIEKLKYQPNWIMTCSGCIYRTQMSEKVINKLSNSR